MAPLIFLLSSCATPDTTVTPYAGAPHYPPSDPSKVEILHAEPTRPHDLLAEIVVDDYTKPPAPITEVEDKLRNAAAKIGADAAVVDSDNVESTKLVGVGHPSSTITDRKLVGVAIKYR
jgi:hypothetical protein